MPSEDVQSREALLTEVRELRERVARYEAMARHFPNGGVFIFDRELRCTLAHGLAFHDPGEPAESLVGCRVVDVCPGVLIDLLVPSLQAAWQGVTSHVQTELNGRHLDVFIAPVQDDAGAVASVMAMSQETTRQVLAERAAERYQRLFSQAEGIAQLGMWEWDMRYDRLFWSDNYYRLLGVSPKETATVERFLGLVHPDDLAAVLSYIKKAREIGAPSTYQYRLICNGMVRHVETTSRYVRDAEGRPVRGFGIVADITERVKNEIRRDEVERELARQQALQIRSDRLRSLGELSASIAHELNQPLVGVRGLAEHLLLSLDRGWDTSPESLRRKLTGILDQADRMEYIVHHIRRYTSDAGRQDFQPTDVNEAVEHAVSMLEAQLMARGIELRRELAPELPAVMANIYSLEEVLLNLLINARDAIEDARASGKPEAGLIVLRSSCSAGEPSQAVIQVCDDAMGIAAELLERIMEPFFTTKGPDRGTGLGLPISQTIVESFGGRLELCSRPGQGTTVSVYLPFEAGDVVVTRDDWLLEL